jgi:hypothetical protein
LELYDELNFAYGTEREYVVGLLRLQSFLSCDPSINEISSGSLEEKESKEAV